MKGLLPVWCRTLGYVVMILAVFMPMFLFMFGVADNSNLIYIKFAMKLTVWVSLFVVFLAKRKDECDEVAGLRSAALKFSLYVWAIIYVFLLVKGLLEGNLAYVDDSTGFIYMVLAVISFEFLSQKRRIENGRR